MANPIETPPGQICPIQLWSSDFHLPKISFIAAAIYKYTEFVSPDTPFN